jgi:hypothetical protein
MFVEKLYAGSVTFINEGKVSPKTGYEGLGGGGGWSYGCTLFLT